MNVIVTRPFNYTGPGQSQDYLVPKIVQSYAFANSVIYVIFDEGTSTTGGGGRIPLIVVGADSAPGVQSARPTNHYGLLRTIEDAWGLAPLGKAAGAKSLTEYSK